MASKTILIPLILFASIVPANCNFEADVLYGWKTKLTDPSQVLQSWDPTLANPCTWYHITCNSENRVTRVDLGDAGISGPLVPELGLLTNLQYLEVYGNKISGSIPKEIGRLTKLVSLDLYRNHLTGSIPTSLGNLKSLKFMRLHSNKLSGTIPIKVIDLVRVGTLQVLNVSDNNFSGTVRPTNITGYAVTTIIQDPKLEA
ncbi:hypothetical protein CRG98_019833 [Punica granatum]|nr:hypothetical protein CRG98_019833 [Punica granatum]